MATSKLNGVNYEVDGQTITFFDAKGTKLGGDRWAINALGGSLFVEVSPYSILGLSATWDVTKYVSLTGGVDNVFDKRHWRAGNAQTTGGAPGTMYGAGAETYNESGRTWYLSVNTHF